MKILEYLYYRMYKAYREKNDSPLFRSFMYITLIQYLLVGMVIVYTENFLTTFNILSRDVLSQIKASYIFWSVIIVAIFLFTFFALMKKPFSYYDDKYSTWKFNKYIKIWMLIFLPFLAFLLSINFYILLFGGTMFGKHITGIFS